MKNIEEHLKELEWRIRKLEEPKPVPSFRDELWAHEETIKGIVFEMLKRNWGLIFGIITTNLKKYKKDGAK